MYIGLRDTIFIKKVNTRSVIVSILNLFGQIFVGYCFHGHVRPKHRFSDPT